MLETDPVISELLSREALPDGTHLLGKQFTITKRMSAGGFGITYRARDNALGRDVVLKECFSEHYCVRSGKNVVARTEDFQKQFRSVVNMFMREAQALAKLRHPNIVGVHRVFEENGTAYMVLDLIDGNDLHDILQSSEQPLPPSLVIDILARLLDAIEKVHECDLLHRDISPDNIIIDHDGNPVLIDFGAARSDASRRTRAISSLLVVKDGYSPKEFYTAGSVQTPSSDLYALAATFYHVVSGEAPVDSQLRMASVASYKPDPCMPLAGRFDHYDPEFLAAIDQAMQPLPNERIQSAGDWRTRISGSVDPIHASAGSAEQLQATLSTLIEETNEVVHKTRILEAEQQSSGKETKAMATAKPAEPSVPEWVEEFNRETVAADTPPKHSRDGAADTSQEDAEGAPMSSRPVSAGRPQSEPSSQDWISRAREKQTRILQADGNLSAPIEVDLAAHAQEQPQIARSQPQPLPQPVETTPAGPNVVISLLKYLSVGLAIGAGLVVIQLQFLT